MIYFDNAATTLIKPANVPLAVFDAINNFANPNRAFYPQSLNASRLIMECRYKISKFFNIDNPLNVSFTSNVTESLNLIIQTFINKDDHVITTVYDHNSVLRPLYKSGCELSIIGLKNKTLDYEIFNKSLKQNTKAVILTHASNLTGDIINLDLISDFCKQNNLLLILDVAQTAGFLKIDMKKHNIDILCFTGHKGLLGPQGIGGICMLNDLEIKPPKTGGSGSNTFDKVQKSKMPDCFEAGTLNTPAIAGLNASLDYINDVGLDNIFKKELALTNYFYDRLKIIDNISIYGNFEFIKCPVVSFNIKDYNSNDVSLYLYEEGEIATRAGFHCVPLLHESLGLKDKGAVRVSFSYFNTFDEVDVLIKNLEDLHGL